MGENPKSRNRISDCCCKLVTLDLSSFLLCCAEPLAALGQKNDTLLHQIGCRQILPVPERDLREVGLSVEEELYEPGLFY